jgi:hypothetical protein
MEHGSHVLMVSEDAVRERLGLRQDRGGCGCQSESDDGPGECEEGGRMHRSLSNDRNGLGRRRAQRPLLRGRCPVGPLYADSIYWGGDAGGRV